MSRTVANQDHRRLEQSPLHAHRALCDQAAGQIAPQLYRDLIDDMRVRDGASPVNGSQPKIAQPEVIDRSWA